MSGWNLPRDRSFSAMNTTQCQNGRPCSMLFNGQQRVIRQPPTSETAAVLPCGRRPNFASRRRTYSVSGPQFSVWGDNALKTPPRPSRA